MTTIKHVFMVMTADGRVFQACSVAVGSNRELRWQFVDEAGRLFVGPPYLRGDDDPIKVRGLVEDWWRTRCALGFAAETVSSMRTKILSRDN